MPDKKKILLDSVKKLIELKVPDAEIVVNLKDVGIDEKQAKKLIKLAKQKPEEAEEELEEKPKEKRKQEKAPPKKEKPLAEEPEEEENPSEVGAEDEKEEKAREETPEKTPEERITEKEKKSFFAKFGKKLAPKPAEEPEPEEKQDEEMAEDIFPEDEEELEEEPEEAPEEEAEEEAKEEPREPEEELEEEPEEKEPKPKPVVPVRPPPRPIDVSKLWEKGILSAVEQRLKEMKEIKQDLDKAIAKKSDEIAKKEVDKIQVLFESQQSLFLEKINAQLEKKSSEVEQLINQKVAELKETSKELQGKIDALDKKKQEHRESLDEIDSKLGELDKTRAELVKQMNSELIKSKSSIQEFLDSAQEKVAEIDDRVNKTLELASSVIEGLKANAMGTFKEMGIKRSEELNRELVTQLEELKSTRASFESQIKGRLAQLDELQKAIKKEFSPGMFKQQMQDLEVFKAQFVKVIEQNVGKFNKAIQKINDQAKTLEGQINSRVKLIDKKIKELEEFEETFANEMGVAVEKTFEKKKAKKKE